MEFFTNEAHICYWLKQKQVLCKAKHSIKAFRGPNTTKFSELEEKLRKHFKDKTQNNGNAVPHKMLVTSA
jgi:hypothetical protein